MGKFRRYAIYYTPPSGPLAQFGAAWLGWDARSGQTVPHPQFDGLSTAEIEHLTAKPRRYGFHATLKPPFRLDSTTDADTLLAELRTHCGLHPAVTLTGGLKLGILNGFLALIPARPSPDLQAMARWLVQGLDRHRAPLNRAERERRHPERLSPAQLANLEQWGYPWVLDEFRFHMTLTRQLPTGRAEQVAAILTPNLAEILPDPMLIDAVALCGEDPTGNWHEISRFKLDSTA